MIVRTRQHCVLPLSVSAGHLLSARTCWRQMPMKRKLNIAQTSRSC